MRHQGPAAGRSGPAIAALAIVAAFAACTGTGGTDSAVAAAAPQPRGPAAEAPATGHGAPGSAARVAFVDPETGALTSQRPEGVEALELSEQIAAAIRPANEQVTVTTLPDGTRVAARPGGFRSALVATVDADGSVRTSHVAGAPAEAPPAVEGHADAP